MGDHAWDEVSARRAADDLDEGTVSRRGLAALPLSVRDLLLHSDDLGAPLAGLAAGFLPVALLGMLLARRMRDERALAIVAVVSWLGWCLTSANLRYGLVMLVALAPFAATAIERALAVVGRTRPRPARIAITAVLSSAMILS